ncbi:filamentous hemagglutinin N-terminal domain-containing protein [Iningainema tapete]|uniref:Filamentous hemagglutinin N-terminal domain-containing protein n=1 Tax=Iningainema tapete BLCC-T55 TaxID=2748662 RepID=A0A8J6XR61_9CYAN|nr:filamentous hemagglutinin N-terminal domain-containing protein [Iningainema tapete]MBD2776845.1 filamentous hemagglutinin N-terminal domain-containing protein [Iningainema tapete BLCC-T55]
MSSANGSANLFLINPNGIIFGKNAALSIGGSFLATTASSLKFADGNQFSAIASQPTPLLTISVPTGLQFGGTNTRSIENQSQVNNGLQVQPGKTLALVGGAITFDSSIQAPGDRVDLAAVSAGTVDLNFTNNILSLNVPESLPREDVRLTNAAIDVRDRGQGSVVITTRNLEISEKSSIAAGISQGLTADSSPRGDINLNATGKVTINYPSRVTNLIEKDAIGDAGNINITAGEITIDNRASAPTDSFIPAAINTGNLGWGRAGNISLFTTGSMNLIGQDPANIDAQVISTFSNVQGRYGGYVTLRSNDSILLKNTFINVARGDGGDISVFGNNAVSIIDNSQLTAGTTQGNSGNITITSNSPVSIDRSWLVNNVGGDELAGNAGNITITGQSVSITTGGALVEASAESQGGNSGNIYINASGKVEISGNDQLNGSPSDRSSRFENSRLTTRAQEGSLGKAGDISITAGEITIDNQASDPALDAGGDGLGASGNVTVVATTGSITLTGQDKNVSDQVISTFSNIQPYGGYITVTANDSILLKNAFVNAARSDGGDITVFANNSVFITDNSQLTTGTTRGNSGNITITSNGLVSIERSWIVNNVGMNELARDGGNITINGKSVAITGGSLVEASAEAKGVNSGNIRITANDQVEISGYDQWNGKPGDRTYDVNTTLTTSSLADARGQAGEISINARNLLIFDGANLIANSENAFKGGNININADIFELKEGGQLLTTAQGLGDAGNINLKVSDLLVIGGMNPNFDKFKNQKFTVSSVGPNSGIFASTTSSQGGNITVETPKLLLLRRNGQISARSLENGNGGNIIINAPKGFLVGISGENSDITANAFNGNGGKITINATGIFGMTVRNREDLIRERKTEEPKELNPAVLPTNDISAFSQTNPSLNGVININTLNVDFNRGLVELPINLVDASQLINNTCNPGSRQRASSFVFTGRGGLAPNPMEMLTPEAVQVEWVSLNSTDEDGSGPSHRRKITAMKPETIVEATGWVRNNQGEIILTANSPTSWQNQTKCGVSKK